MERVERVERGGRPQGQGGAGLGAVQPGLGRGMELGVRTGLERPERRGEEGPGSREEPGLERAVPARRSARVLGPGRAARPGGGSELRPERSREEVPGDPERRRKPAAGPAGDSPGHERAAPARVRGAAGAGLPGAPRMLPCFQGDARHVGDVGLHGDGAGMQEDQEQVGKMRPWEQELRGEVGGEGSKGDPAGAELLGMESASGPWTAPGMGFGGREC